MALLFRENLKSTSANQYVQRINKYLGYRGTKVCIKIVSLFIDVIKLFICQKWPKMVHWPSENSWWWTFHKSKDGVGWGDENCVYLHFKNETTSIQFCF